MKLKYYMRGVGTGILFTLFVFVVIIIPNLKLENRIISSTEQTKNDSDVSSLVGRDDAKAEVTPEAADTTTPQPTEQPTQEPTKEPTKEPTATPTQAPTEAPTTAPTKNPTPTVAPTKAPTATPTQAPTKTPTATPTQAPTKTPTPTLAPTKTPEPTKTPTKAPTPTAEVDEDGTVKFTITYGMTSETFAKAMEKSGIVDDWSALNSYITRNGYAKKIQVGTFKFTPGMTYHDICKKIVGGNMK